VNLLLVVRVSMANDSAILFFWLGDFLVLLYYDYMLTLHQEVQFLWPPHNKQSWFTLAFFINRYVPMIGVLPIVVSLFIPLSPAVRPSSLTV
jgi:hypothetical protein